MESITYKTLLDLYVESQESPGLNILRMGAKLFLCSGVIPRRAKPS